MKLASYLKKSRVKAGLTQSEVATKLGYTTPQFISNWERGISYPPKGKLTQLGGLYDISVGTMAKVLLDDKITKMRHDLAQAVR